MQETAYEKSVGVAPIRSWLAVGLMLLWALGQGACRRGGLARAASNDEADQKVGLFASWQMSRGQGEDLPISDPLYVGSRPPCPQPFASLLSLGDIERHCGIRARPIVFAGPNWCRYRFPGGNFLFFHSPSFSYLRQSFVEGATLRTAVGWAFSWSNGKGLTSIVLRQPDGSALVLQAPRSICPSSALEKLSLLAAARMASASNRFPFR